MTQQVVLGDSSWCKDFEVPKVDIESEEMGIFKGSHLMTHHSDTKGNHVHAMRDIKEGEVALVQKPLAAVVSPAWAMHLCANCFRGERPVTIHCEGCNHASWCSKECMTEHSSIHQYECETFQHLKRQEVAERIWGSHTMMYLVCSMLARPVNSVEMLPNRPLNRPPTSQAEAFALLTGNIDDISEDDEEEYRNNAKIQKLLCPAAEKFSIEDLILLNSRVACNCFRIENEELVTVGLAVYPGASFFNHSCVPNVVYAHDGADLVFRAVHPIPVGGEACISYIRLVNNRQKRQSHLASLYYFKCVCSRCNTEPVLPQLEHIHCAKPDCDGTYVSDMLNPHAGDVDADAKPIEESVDDWMELNIKPTPRKAVKETSQSGTEDDTLAELSLPDKRKMELAELAYRVFQFNIYGEDSDSETDSQGSQEDSEDEGVDGEGVAELELEAAASSDGAPQLSSDESLSDTASDGRPTRGRVIQDSSSSDDSDSEDDSEEGSDDDDDDDVSIDPRVLQQIPAKMCCDKCHDETTTAMLIPKLAEARFLLDHAKSLYKDSEYDQAQEQLKRVGEIMEKDLRLNSLHPYNYKYLKLASAICSETEDLWLLARLHKETITYLENTLPHRDFELGVEHIAHGDVCRKIAERPELIDHPERQMELYKEAQEAYGRGHSVYSVAYGPSHVATTNVFAQMSAMSQAQQQLVIESPEIVD